MAYGRILGTLDSISVAFVKMKVVATLAALTATASAFAPNASPMRYVSIHMASLMKKENEKIVFEMSMFIISCHDCGNGVPDRRRLTRLCSMTSNSLG